jgi:hypothetical protein
MRVICSIYTQHVKVEEQHHNKNRVLSRSPHHCGPKHSWIHRTLNCQLTEQEPTDINVLQVWVLTNIFKILKIKKDEIHIVLNIITALQIKKTGYILHFVAQPNLT